MCDNDTPFCCVSLYRLSKEHHFICQLLVPHWNTYRNRFLNFPAVVEESSSSQPTNRQLEKLNQQPMSSNSLKKIKSEAMQKFFCMQSAFHQMIKEYTSLINDAELASNALHQLLCFVNNAFQSSVPNESLNAGNIDAFLLNNISTTDLLFRGRQSRDKNMTKLQEFRKAYEEYVKKFTPSKSHRLPLSQYDLVKLSNVVAKRKAQASRVKRQSRNVPSSTDLPSTNASSSSSSVSSKTIDVETSLFEELHLVGVMLDKNNKPPNIPDKKIITWVLQDYLLYQKK